MLVNESSTFASGLTAVMAILIVVVLAVALNLRKKIERNEDSGDSFFRRNTLRIEDGEEDDNIEDAEDDDNIEDGEEDYYNEDNEEEEDEQGDK